MLEGIAQWWDGVELWLTQLPFPFQVLLAVLVLLPGCWIAAAGFDRALEWLLAAVAARRAGAPVEPAAEAAPDAPVVVPENVPDPVPDGVRTDPAP